VKKGKLNNAVSDRESSPNTSTLKATMYGNLNSKINSIEREMEGLKKENEKLNHELNSKLTELLKLKTSNQELEMKVVILQEVKNKQKNQNEPVHTLTISKDKLKEIPKPTCTQSTVPPVSPASQNTENQLSMFVSNISRNSVAQQSSSLQEIKPAPSPKKLNQTHYKRSQIGDFTLRKLMVNVIKSDLSY
jgi:predicted RNase H-like nuclease (RuvC/YqgF family)